MVNEIHGKTVEMIREQIKTNNPPIEVGDIWCSTVNCVDGRPYRRIRILARYPGIDSGDSPWIFEELPGAKLKLDAYRLGKIQEFNLRYTMRPE